MVRVLSLYFIDLLTFMATVKQTSLQLPVTSSELSLLALLAFLMQTKGSS